MIDCLFCRIVAGEIPADVVLRTDEVVAFRDISPQAPMHVLVIPVEHHTNVAELSAIPLGAVIGFGIPDISIFGRTPVLV